MMTTLQILMVVLQRIWTPMLLVIVVTLENICDQVADWLEGTAAEPMEGHAQVGDWLEDPLAELMWGQL